MHPAIGLLEFNSISKGIETADVMVKASSVDLLEAHPICPGKFMVLITGSVEAVKSSIASGKEAAGYTLVDEFIIPNVHPQVFMALTATSNIEEIKALGVIETFTAASSILAADCAAKTASVSLIEIRLANGMGGKSFVTLTGEVAAVNAAVRAAEDLIKNEGWLLASVVIPSPHKDLEKAIF